MILPFFLSLGLLPILAVSAPSEEHPLIGPLPNAGEHWQVTGSGSRTDKFPHSWVNLRNEESGDVLSYVAESWDGVKITDSPVRQASIETFTSEGLARFSVEVRGNHPIEDQIRNRFVTLRLGIGPEGTEVKALEFTYLYGSDPDTASSIGHGYIAVVNDTVFSVQHTSEDLITSSLALDMICHLVHGALVEPEDQGKMWSYSVDQPQ